MRIARVLTRPNLGGPVRQVLASDPRLMERGHELRLFVGTPEPGEGDLHDQLVARGLDVVRVPGLSRGIAPTRDWSAGRRLRRELARFAPDVLHTHASKAGLLGRLAERGGAARVHTFHGHVLEGYFGPAMTRVLVSLEQRLARRTDRIVAVSHSTADDLLRLEVAQVERLVVIPPGVELESLLSIERPREGAPRVAGALRRKLGIEASCCVVGVLGRLAEVKRPELALEVFGQLAERYPPLVLVYIGDGAQRGTLEERVAGLPADLAGRCHLAGSWTDMGQVLGDLDVVLSVSRSEGMPVSMIEAGAAGVPVVATPVGGVPELVTHERTGMLGESPAELAFGLQALLDRPRERIAMGQRARLRMAEKHAADGLADRLEALYHTVVEERRAS